MKIKKYITLTIQTFFVIPLFCLSWNDVKFSITPEMGVMYGKIGEYIYTSGTGADQYMISSLDWNITPGFTFGADTELSIGKFNINAGVSSLYPTICGSMYDLDYRPGLTVNRCSFDNVLNKSLNVYCDISYDFNPTERLTFRPNFQLEYAYYSFSGTNGSGYFGEATFTSNSEDVSWDDEKAKYAKSVSGIDYETDSLFTYIGGTICYSYKNWDFSFGTYISPFTYTRAIDYHRDERNIADSEKEDYYAIHTTISYFTRIKEIISISYRINLKTKIIFTTEFKYGNKTKGTIITNKYRSTITSGIFSGSESSDWQLLNQPCGTELILLKTNFGLQIKI